MGNRKSANKMHHIWREALRIRIKKFRQNLLKNYSKSTKIAITACKFSKISGEHAPDPLQLFLFLNQLQICSVAKKIRLKNVEIVAPPPTSFKFLVTSLSVQKQRVSEILCKRCENDFSLSKGCGPLNDLGTTEVDIWVVLLCFMQSTRNLVYMTY